MRCVARVIKGGWILRLANASQPPDKSSIPVAGQPSDTACPRKHTSSRRTHIPPHRRPRPRPRPRLCLDASPGTGSDSCASSRPAHVHGRRRAGSRGKCRFRYKADAVQIQGRYRAGAEAGAGSDFPRKPTTKPKRRRRFTHKPATKLPQTDAQIRD
jgi:hypothetical protein